MSKIWVFCNAWNEFKRPASTVNDTSFPHLLDLDPRRETDSDLLDFGGSDIYHRIIVVVFFNDLTMCQLKILIILLWLSRHF